MSNKREFVWALDEQGNPCKCYASPENRGKGRCKHTAHVKQGESINSLKKNKFNDQQEVITKLLIDNTLKAESCLPSKEIKVIEKWFKKTHTGHSHGKIYIPKNIKALLDKLTTGRMEVKQQLATGRTLQPGVLNECVILQSIAKELNLSKCINAEQDKTSIPPKLWNILALSNKEVGGEARYIYYDKGNDNVIIQYGAPGIPDAAIYSNGGLLKIELKDSQAYIKDKTLKYDENGKVIIPNDLEPVYKKELRKFNKETNLFNEMGHNVPLDSGISELLGTDFNFDVLIIRGRKDALIPVTKNNLNYKFKDGTPLLTTKGSEIRTKGKNNSSVFTPVLLETAFKKNNVNVVNDECSVDKKCIVPEVGRGTTKVTRYRIIDTPFFVHKENIKERNGSYIFDKNSIKQLTMGISGKIKVTKSKQKIIDELYSDN